MATALPSLNSVSTSLKEAGLSILRAPFALGVSLAVLFTGETQVNKLLNIPWFRDSAHGLGGLALKWAAARSLGKSRRLLRIDAVKQQAARSNLTLECAVRSRDPQLVIHFLRIKEIADAAKKQPTIAVELALLQGRLTALEMAIILLKPEYQLNFDKKAAFRFAIKMKRYDIATILLEFNEVFNSLNEKDIDIVRKASKANKQDLVARLITHPKIRKEIAKSDRVLLNKAAWAGRFDIVDSLMKLECIQKALKENVDETVLAQMQTYRAVPGHPNIRIVDLEDRDNQRIGYKNSGAFCAAAYQGNLGLMKELINKGKQLSNDEINLAFKLSVKGNHPDIVNFFLDNQTYREILKQYLNSGTLGNAIKTQNIEMFNRLLDAFPKSANVENLNLAAEKGNPIIVERLLENDFFIVNGKKNYAYGENTPLRLAATNGHILVVNKLLEYPCVQEQLAKTHTKLLRQTMKKGHVEVALRILQQESVRTNLSLSAALDLLYSAARYGKTELLDELLKSEKLKAFLAKPHTPLTGLEKRYCEMVILPRSNNVLKRAINALRLTILRWWVAPRLDSEHKARLQFSVAINSAALHGHPEAFDRLLMADNHYATQSPERNQKYFICTSIEGSGQMVERFLLFPGVKNNHALQLEALTIAVSMGRQQVVETLLNQPKLVELIPATHNKLVVLAAENGHDRVLEKLFEKVPALKETAHLGGNKALNQAAGNGHVKVMDVLIKNCEKVRDNAHSWFNYTLRKALWNHQFEAEECLLKLPNVAEHAKRHPVRFRPVDRRLEYLATHRESVLYAQKLLKPAMDALKEKYKETYRKRGQDAILDEFKEYLISEYQKDPAIVDDKILPIDCQSPISDAHKKAYLKHSIHKAYRLFFWDPNPLAKQKPDPAISEDSRLTAATIWLALTDPELKYTATPREDAKKQFVTIISETARNYNSREDELDDPSCSVGSSARIAGMLQFLRDATPALKELISAPPHPSLVLQKFEEAHISAIHTKIEALTPQELKETSALLDTLIAEAMDLEALEASQRTYLEDLFATSTASQTALIQKMDESYGEAMKVEIRYLGKKYPNVNEFVQDLNKDNINTLCNRVYNLVKAKLKTVEGDKSDTSASPEAAALSQPITSNTPTASTKSTASTTSSSAAVIADTASAQSSSVQGDASTSAQNPVFDTDALVERFKQELVHSNNDKTGLFDNIDKKSLLGLSRVSATLRRLNQNAFQFDALHAQDSALLKRVFSVDENALALFKTNMLDAHPAPIATPIMFNNTVFASLDTLITHVKDNVIELFYDDISRKIVSHFSRLSRKTRQSQLSRNPVVENEGPDSAQDKHPLNSASNDAVAKKSKGKVPTLAEDTTSQKKAPAPILFTFPSPSSDEQGPASRTRSSRDKHLDTEGPARRTRSKDKKKRAVH